MSVRGLPSGFLHGAAAWLVYGIVETAAVMIVPRLFRPAIDFRYLHHEWAGLLLLLYAAAGGFLGALIAMVLPRSARRDEGLRGAASATVALVFAVNLIAQFAARPSALPFSLGGLAGALGLLLLGTCGSERWRRRLRFLASPWTVALLLVGPPWLTKDFLGTQHALWVRA